MDDYSKTNLYDSFFTHVLEVDPLNLLFDQRGMKNESSSDKIIPYPDPRTNSEIPNQECSYQDCDISVQNIFMKNPLSRSMLTAEEHVACIEALQTINNGTGKLTPKQETCWEKLAECTEEKRQFLEELRTHFLEKLSHRAHEVPPQIEHFVVNVWKRKIVELHRTVGKAHIQLKTALILQCVDVDVHAKLIYGERHGQIRKTHDVEYIRQSSAILQQTYKEQRNPTFSRYVKCKVAQLRQLYDVHFQVPLSIVRLLLCDESDWCVPITVHVSKTNAIFESDRVIIFEKRLPPCYRSGNARYRTGAKYAVRSCLARTVDDGCDAIDINGGLAENATSTYKLNEFDEYLKLNQDKESKADAIKANKLLNIFEISGNVDEGVTDTYRVLITSKQDAYKLCPNGEMVYINYSPKIELQAEYGGEIMTKNELIREWCDLYFRPNSIIERG